MILNLKYMNKNNSTFLLLFLSITLTGVLNAQSLTDSFKNIKSFCLNNEGDVDNIWGSKGVATISGIYFDELLPAFFKRKIELTKSEFKTSKLKWIFTGSDGGITVAINKDSIYLEQRYYDSFGLTKLQNSNVSNSRYPESQFTTFKTSFDEEVKSITLEINHSLGLKLVVNDKLIVEQSTQLDLSQHQLMVEGTDMDVCGSMQVPKAQTVNLKINESKKYQKILGFGGITSPVAYNLLSEDGKKKWWDYIREYNLLIQREYPIGSKLNQDFSNWDSLDDATPHYYGDNFPNGEISDFDYNAKIQDMGGFVVFEFWRLPDWMVYNSQKEPNYEKYTEAMVNYCKTAKQKTGKAPKILGIQNEVSQSPEVWQKLTLELREALDKNGFDYVKIHMHNSNRLVNGIKALDAFTEKTKVWEAIDYSASNLYDYQNYFLNPDGYDEVIEKWHNSHNGQPAKPFISTELCINNGNYQSGSYRVAFLMGELYHKNMVDLNAISLMYCWLLINNTQPSFSASRSLFAFDESMENPKASSFQLRIFGAFSKHLHQDYERIQISSSDENLLVSAYQRGDETTVIVLNRDISPKKINLTEFKNISQMEVVSQYKEKSIIKLNDKGEIVLEPGTIATFY